MCQFHLLLGQFQPSLIPPRTMLGDVGSWFIWKITNPPIPAEKPSIYLSLKSRKNIFCWNFVFLIVFKYTGSLFSFASSYPSVQIKTYLFYAQIKFLFGEKSISLYIIRIWKLTKIYLKQKYDGQIDDKVLPPCLWDVYIKSPQFNPWWMEAVFSSNYLYIFCIFYFVIVILTAKMH